jgi:hypothetical protein
MCTELNWLSTEHSGDTSICHGTKYTCILHNYFTSFIDNSVRDIFGEMLNVVVEHTLNFLAN